MDALERVARACMARAHLRPGERVLNLDMAIGGRWIVVDICIVGGAPEAEVRRVVERINVSKEA